jgi:hypothetical protein
MKRASRTKRRKVDDDDDEDETSSTTAASGGSCGDAIVFFTTQRDMMRKIASYVTSTRQLFSFLLHVSSKMREEYTTYKRWNDVFDLRRRIRETWGRIYACPQNVLGYFVRWADNPTSCLAGCGGVKPRRAPYCMGCFKTRVKHTSKEIARIRFAAMELEQKHHVHYYYACRPKLPPRTLQDEFKTDHGMVSVDNVLGRSEALRICAQEGLELDLRKHQLEFWDHEGRCVGGTLECILRGWVEWE